MTKPKMMKPITGPQRKFCEGIVRGFTGTDAYAAAYPKVSRDVARKTAPRLLAKAGICAEIERLRAKADEKAGSAVLSLAEKRLFVARLVRAQPGLLDRDSDLWQSVKVTDNGTEMRLPDKLAAIKLDNDLSGEGSEASAVDEIADLLKRLNRSKNELEDAGSLSV